MIFQRKMTRNESREMSEEKDKGEKRMTCIVGYVEPETGVMYMGGDSACYNDREMSVQAGSKVVKRRDILIGCAGSPRVGDILQHVFVPPVYRPEKKSLLSFLAVDFTGAMKRVLKAAGERSDKLEEQSALLIGLHGRLSHIEDNFCVLETACHYHAIGVGAYFALGAMHATADLPPTERISRALAAAEAHCPGVRSPFTPERIEPPQEPSARTQPRGVGLLFCHLQGKRRAEQPQGEEAT
jgi:ATP-dependent protease HslVU (ClpYQ) peptidase subunit